MPGLLPLLGCFLDDFNSCAASIACCFKVKSLSTFMDTVTIYFNSFLWQRLPVTPKRPVITSSQPPSGRKSMSRKSNLRLTSWLSWQIRSIQGSLIPSPKLRSRFRRPTPYFRTQARDNLRSSPYPRVTCYRCGTPGHKSTQCWKRVPAARNFSPGHPGHNHPDRPLSNMSFDAIEVKQTSLQCVFPFCIPPFS